MTDTPETKIPQGSPAVGGTTSGAAAPQPAGWHLSEEARHDEHRYDDNAAARERWERRHYGWALFAVVVLVMAGGFQVVNGLVALFRSGTYVVGSNGLVVDVDYTAWGWLHLGLGVLALVAALGLSRGQLWARILGVAFAVLSAIAYMVFMPAFPALSLVVIALDVLVVYAITAHGGDLKDDAGV
jgi:hypothetical protein